MDAITTELTVFWRKLGRLIESGVPFLHALDVVKQEAGNAALRQAIETMNGTLAAGGSLTEALAKSPDLFPLAVRTIVKVGESTGRLDKVAFTIADGIADGSLLQAAPEQRGAVLPGTCPTTAEAGDDAPVIELCSSVIMDAIRARASDIHLECSGSGLRVRVRVDGVLRDSQVIPARLTEPVIGRFKAMAGLNLAEKRLPQDGRIILKVESKDMDLRVSATPCIDGENLVIRILAAPAQLPPLEMQSFTAPQLARLRSWMARSHGLILVTGPTGSGKTTTYYSMVQEMNRPDIKIMMVEDPVEIRIPGVSQLQVRPALGLTFAAALRAFLRQDPDVLVVGEIRDLETAQVMAQAALTGHLVMSTLHTDDAAEALQRLIDLGLPPFLLNGVLVGVLAQRLVRRVCPKCKEEYTPDPAALAAVVVPLGARFFHGKGCEHCHNSGYRGRIAIHEFLEMNDALRRAVKDDAGPARYNELAQGNGLVPLRDDGIAKALAGETTVEEVLRACGR